MLDPWIIEEIRRREEEERRDERAPAVIELPMPELEPTLPSDGRPNRRPDEDTPRGIAIIDFSVM
jgi:hypothetical protein